ncbi:hypothetical protein L7F22_040802 [Adiantum nelumboides]|nr:hypothetical protein [Adiantum nelumboides]MCO5586857.1 hypothetical protein [Adiantum nelumboides]
MDDSSLSNLKTHDWHNLLKHVLPLVIDGFLTTGVCDVIYRLGKLARWITAKEIDISSVAQKKRKCIELLCLMEKELPTSFFDIQFHVLIHLVDEIEIAVPKVISNAQGRRRRGKSSKTKPLSILGWLSHRIKDGIMKGEVISEKQREIGHGCDRAVHGYTNMWSYGQHIRVNKIDPKRQAQDLCIISSFKQQSRASARDTHLIEEELVYVETIAGIYELGYRICKRVISNFKRARATMRQECSGFWSVDSSKPLRVTREAYILLAHYEQAFSYTAPHSKSPWRQVVPINPQGRRIFDTTYMEADQDSLHKDEPTSTKPLQLTTLAQEEPQEEAVDDNDALDDETKDLAVEFDFEPHHLEERPSIDVPPTLALDVHLTTKELQEMIQDNEEIELIIDLF